VGDQTQVSEVPAGNLALKIRVCFSFMGDDVLCISVPNYSSLTLLPSSKRTSPRVPSSSMVPRQPRLSPLSAPSPAPHGRDVPHPGRVQGRSRLSPALSQAFGKTELNVQIHSYPPRVFIPCVHIDGETPPRPWCCRCKAIAEPQLPHGRQGRGRKLAGAAPALTPRQLVGQGTPWCEPPPGPEHSHKVVGGAKC